jgi:acetyl-CoA C-acetyltransferase
MSAPNVAIVGAYEHPTRLAPDKDEWQLTAEVARAALEQTGLKPSDIQGYFMPPSATMGGYIGPGAALLMSDYLNIKPRFIDETDVGGASFGYYVNRAALAINAGLIDTALITYASLARSGHVDIGSGRTGKAAPIPESFEQAYGLAGIAFYALLARRYMHEYGVAPEALAAVAVSARRNAAANPDAAYRDPITVDDVLTSPEIASPLHRLDCCIVSDGAGAIILASRRMAQQCRSKPVWVAGFGEAIMHTDGGRSGWMNETVDMVATASRQAYAMAGIGPDDIDVAGVYDAFTINVLLGLEGLGVCGRGEAGNFMEERGTGRDGGFPMNLDGGGLSSNHPGRRGLFLLIEATRQLRGEAGPWQRPGAKTAVTIATGAASLVRRASATHVLVAD